MFGYIVPDKPEMKIKEYELFNAFYCGICKSIGIRYGNIPRLVLKYDCAFLAVLLYSLTGGTITIDKKRCVAHPLKARCIILKNDIIDYAADINLILSFFDFTDKSKDKDYLVSKTAVLYLRPLYKKLRNKYKAKCEIIENNLTELAILEKNGCTSMDTAAEPFAKIMEEIVAYNPACKDKNAEKTLRWLGYNLGKWIYLLDAYDDMETDLKNGNYNPLYGRISNKNKNEMNIAELKNEVRERVEFNLIYSLDQIGKAYQLLETKNVNGILENIIYQGLLKKTENILGTRSCNKSESL